VAGLRPWWSVVGMSETQNPTEPPFVRRRRKPGLANLAAGTGGPPQATTAVEGHYEESPQPSPAVRGEQVFTVSLPRRAGVSGAQGWLGLIVGSRVTGRLLAGLLVLSMAVGLATAIRGDARHTRHRAAPPATRASAPSSFPARPVRRRYRSIATRHRRALLSPRRPGYAHARVPATRPAEPGAIRPARSAAPAAVIVQASPVQPASAPAEGAGEQQTRGGPFSP
jgi:hypothetical protein